MGKAGLIGRKIAATLASTGTRSHFVHPAEALHGDLGCIHQQDVVLVLSNSGQTEEVVRLLPSLAQLGVPMIAITRDRDNELARQAMIVLQTGRLDEADALGLAPSTTTTVMLAIGDALALVVSQCKGFQPSDFARFHPGGSLGRKLRSVTEVMRPLAECRLANETQTVRQVLVQAGRPGRRTGAIMLVDQHQRLTGIFTDSDLARLFEACNDTALDQPILCVMRRQPMTVSHEAMSDEAVELLARHKISELPVIDQRHRPLGVIDVTDVMSWLPASGAKPARALEKAAHKPVSGTPLPAIIPFLNQESNSHP
jgi:arabinose-5-phosphate isomerase